MYSASVIICIVMCVTFAMGTLFVEVWGDRITKRKQYFQTEKGVIVKHTYEEHILYLKERVNYYRRSLELTQEALEKATHTRDDYR